MVKGRIAICCFLLVILSAVVSTTAQQKRPPQKTAKAPSKPIPVFVSTPFNFTGETLPQDFLGHDAKAIFDTLEQQKWGKSEFETTAEFSSRIAGIGKAPLLGTMTGESQFGFVLEHCDSRYDADMGILLITVPLEFFKSGSLYGVTWKSTLADSRSYVGSNAFGAKVVVKKEYFQDYGLAFDPEEWVSQQWRFRDGAYVGAKDKNTIVPKLQIYLQMSASDAAALKDRLRLLFVGTLKEPWFARKVYHEKPTIDDPNDTLISYRLLRMKPSELLLFDQTTGRVLLRLAETTYREQFPLSVKIQALEALDFSNCEVVVDGKRSDITLSEGESSAVDAKNTVSIQISGVMRNVPKLKVYANGKLVESGWKEQRDSIGNYRFLLLTAASAPH